MLTLIVILVGLWLVRGKNSDIREKMSKIVLFVFVLIIEITFIAVYFTNLFFGPIDLAKAQEQARPVEEKIEALIANFSYAPEEEGSREKLDAFLDEYIALSNDLEEANAEITKHEHRANSHWTGNRVTSFVLTFGLF